MVKLSRHLDSQHKTIVGVVRPSQLVGARAITTEGRQRYTADALEDCVLLEISCDLFRQCCDNSTEAFAWIAQQAEQRLEEVQRRFELIAYARVERRILSLLVELADGPLIPHGEPAASIPIPLSQSEIAQLIGATRETASTTLNQLARKGLLRLGRRQIEVLSLPAVRHASEHGFERAMSAHA